MGVTSEAAAVAAQAASARVPRRVRSIDIVRGAVMVLMAIDHVRVYSGIPAGGPTPGVFFTRWITHFVAPAFIFLAGTAAYMHGRKLAGRGELARFLVTRGIILVLLELTLIRFMWTFNFDFRNYMLAGVIWVIGVCMILLAALIHLPVRAVGIFGLAVIVGHNLLQSVPLPDSPVSALLYVGGDIDIGFSTLAILYTVIPWIGVMAAGYAFGTIVQLPHEERRALCIRIGLATIALFLLLRMIDVYGDPRQWRDGDGPVLLRFLNTSKYPASLLFLLMTLGPTILAVGLVEKARGRLADVLTTFGRVPLFYYLLHIPAIHLAAIVVSMMRFGYIEPWLFANHPMWPPETPEGYRWSLPLLYMVTTLVVLVLYRPCRSFARIKRERRDLAWLSYL